MHRAPRLVALAAATLLIGGLAACSDDSDPESSGSGDFSPITIEHALGTTTISEKPERVATVAWAMRAATSTGVEVTRFRKKATTNRPS